jgi:hypothetical protein
MSEGKSTPWQAGSKGMLSGRIQLVRAQAVQRGGRCTVRFSQSLPPVINMLKEDKRTKEGVCLTLMYRWLTEVVKAQPKFWSGVFEADGRVNAAFFGTIMVQELSPGRINVQAQGHQADAPEADAGKHSRLVAAGFQHTKPQEITGQNAVTIAAGVLDGFLEEIRSNLNNKRYCLQMNLKKIDGGSGHVIGAVPMSSGDILLMDPNLGEFSFADGDKLVTWMTKDLANFYYDAGGPEYDKLGYIVWVK